MSDLQCPVRVLLASEQWAVERVDYLRDRRIAAVVSIRPAERAEDVALQLNTPVSVRAGQLPDVLDEVADSFRGETVLVVSQPDAIVAFSASLGPRAVTEEHLDDVGVIAVEGDSAGWRYAPIF